MTSPDTDSGPAGSGPAPAGEASAAAPADDPGVRAAQDRLRAERTRAAHEATGRAHTDAEKAAQKSAKSAGWKNVRDEAKRLRGSNPLTTSGLSNAKNLLAMQHALGKDLAEKGATKLGAGAKVATAARFLPVAGAVVSGGIALKNLSDGDFAGAALAAVGAIPGPVGWAGIAASLVYETWGPGGEGIGLWDKPDGTSTFMLPASAAEADGVIDADVQLREAQASVFAFKDGPTGTVWDSAPPDALRLDAVSKAASAWTGGVSKVFAAIESTLTSSGEPYFADYAAKLGPHLTAMAELPSVATALGTQLAAVSDTAAVAYADVLRANRDLRTQLSDSAALSDQGSLTVAQSSLAAADTAVDRADANIGGLLSTTPAAALVASTATAPDTAPAPAPLAPTAPLPMPGVTAPGAGGGAKPDEKNEISKLLESLGKAQAPAMPQVPMGGGGNPLGGMGGGSPLGGGNPMGNGQGRKLDGGEGRKLDDKADRKLDDKERRPLEEKSDRKLSTAGGPANSVAAAPAPAGAPAGTPAVKPEAAAAKPGSPTKPNTEVDVKGERVDFKDPKLAKMAQLLASATPQQPMSLSDAAAASGLTPPVPHADPGRQVQPVDAKPGDILVADGKQFMLLGEGRFYDLQDFKTVGASELPQDAGSRGGYFSLNDPGDPSGGGGAPVSPPAGGVPHDVPGGQPPAATVDASPAGAGPVPAGGTGAVPSTGSPGVPAAGTGGGPANANATATGTGVPKPTTGGAPLDPAAVR